MPEPPRLDVLTDGACPFCRWVRARVEPFDTDARLRWLDYHEPGVAANVPFSADELSREMHVRTAGGAWHAGFAAWVAVLRELPLLRWLGMLLGSPLFRKSGPRLYAWVARHRYRLPGAPRPDSESTCPLHCARPQK
jgi:predicted DCC family thiol-disulfide oxidoreductase YuxK